MHTIYQLCGHPNVKLNPEKSNQNITTKKRKIIPTKPNSNSSIALTVVQTNYIRYGVLNGKKGFCVMHKTGCLWWNEKVIELKTGNVTGLYTRFMLSTECLVNGRFNWRILSSTNCAFNRFFFESHQWIPSYYWVTMLLSLAGMIHNKTFPFYKVYVAKFAEV